MLVETRALWSRGEKKDLPQETTFSPKLLQHVQLVLPTPLRVCPTHGTVILLGLSAYLSSLRCQVGSAFPSLLPRARELGHSWHRCVLRVTGSRKKGMG